MEVIDLAMKTREIISREQRRLATLPPPVNHHVNTSARGATGVEGRMDPNDWPYVVLVDLIFQLQPYQAADTIKDLLS